jgi:hypothetical protein
MRTTVKVITRGDDPLGYDGSVLERVRAMAEDAVAGVNAQAVKEEAALLRNRLGVGARRVRINAVDSGQ